MTGFIGQVFRTGVAVKATLQDSAATLNDWEEVRESNAISEESILNPGIASVGLYFVLLWAISSSFPWRILWQLNVKRLASSSMHA